MILAKFRNAIGLIACLIPLLVLAVGVVPSSLHAQAGNADLLGTVTDSTGAVITNATVTAHNLATGIDRVVTTNAKGDYVATLLPNGHYLLKVEAQGFKIFTIASFTLESGDRLRMDAKLQPGTVTEEIKVEATTEAVLQTDSATVTNTIDEKATQDLPLNNRNIQGALALMPGIVQSGTSGSGLSVSDRRPSVDVSVNGQLSTYNNNLIDGFDNNERNNGFAGVRPSIDGIQEMKVDTSVFRAEVGRAGGGAINLITKSGTNSFHGSAFEYLRNEALDANGYLFGNTSEKGRYRQNIYGGNIGGPVWLPKLYNGHNKTFFFFDFEKGDLHQGTPTLVTLPTTYELQNAGDFTDLQGFCSNGPPGSPSAYFPAVNLNEGFDSNALDPGYNLGTLYVNPTAKKLWSLIPQNLTKTAGAQLTSGTCNGYDYKYVTPNNYVSTAPQTQNTKTWSVRIDHHISDKDQIFGRFADNPVYTYFPGYFPQVTQAAIDAGIYSTDAKDYIGIYPGGNNNKFPGPSNTISRNVQLDYVHIFNANMIGDLKAGYSRVSIITLPLNYGIGAAEKLGIPYVHYSSIPSTDVLPIWDLGNFQLGSSNAVPSYSVNNNFQYAGSLTYTHGSHTFKFGASVIRRQLLDFTNQEGGGSFPTPNNSITGLNNQAQFLTGYAQVSMRAVDLIEPHYQAWEYGFFGQDDWRVNSKLTLNLGLRYDIFPPWKEAHNLMSGFDISSFTYILAKNDTSVNCSGCIVSQTLGVKTNYKDFSPRIGFAYSITPKTVIRGGYGMSWYPLEIGVSSAGTSPSNMIALPNAPYVFAYSYKPGTSYYVPPFWAGGPAQISTTGVNYQSDMSACSSYYNSTTGQLIDSASTPYNCNNAVTDINVRPTNSRPFMVQQINLTLQRQLGDYSIAAGFVGVVTNGMVRGINLNQPDPPGNEWATANPGQAAQFIYASKLPYVNNIAQNYNGNNGHYTSLQVVVERQFKQGLRVNGNYTWSHALDTVANGVAIWTSNAHYDYGNSGQDIRHRVVGTVNYTLPFGNNTKGLTRTIVNGWQLVGTFTASSGGPIDIQNSTFGPGAMVTARVPGLTTDRPSVKDGYWNKLTLSHKTTSKWFNTDAFEAQPVGTAGNASKNLLRGPGSRNSDLSLLKDFAFTEKMKVQFRAEAFNFANLVNWGTPDNNISDNTFGQITTTTGSPRQMQVALKLIF